MSKDGKRRKSKRANRPKRLKRPGRLKGPGRARPVTVPVAAREMIRKIERATEKKTTPPPKPPTRHLTIDDEEWIAQVKGHGVIGHGALARAAVVTIRFTPVDDRERPARETLVPDDRFEYLYDEELRELWDNAKPVKELDQRTRG